RTRHGVFTYYLIEGLNGAAADAAGRITTKSLHSYLKPRVQDEARLLNRDFLLLWQGQLVSLLGSQAFTLAVLYYAAESTGSATLLGTLWGGSRRPGLLLTPLGGAVADRRSRRALLVACDLLSAGSSFLLAGVFTLAGSGNPLLAAALCAAAVLDEVVLAFLVPALSAALPDVVPRERLAAANSLFQGAAQASSVGGKAAAGALYVWLGPPALFLLDGLTFLYAAGSEALVRLPAPAPRPAGEPKRARALVRDLGDALGFVRCRQGLLPLLVSIGVAEALTTPVFVLLPFYVRHALGHGADWYGFVSAAFGAGSVAGLAAAGVRMGRAVRPASAGLGIAGLSLVGLATVRAPWAALLLLATAGAGLSLANVAFQSFFQGAAPTPVRGRVMALMQTVGTGAGILGAWSGGIAGDLAGKDVSLIYGFCGSALALLGLGLGVRRLAGADRRSSGGDAEDVLHLPEQIFGTEGLLDEARGTHPE
ncbi:MAG: MFS transporter, partial [Deltaproteobacteria bacterium]|nr:MFS transporter [Deltaproteobacteria bacterium]